MSDSTDSPIVSWMKGRRKGRNKSQSEIKTNWKLSTANAILEQRVELLQNEIAELREREGIKATINDKMMRAFKGMI